MPGYVLTHAGSWPVPPQFNSIALGQGSPFWVRGLGQTYTWRYASCAQESHAETKLPKRVSKGDLIPLGHQAARNNLEAYLVPVLKCWIDASFAIHPGMHGHTGGVLTLGWCAVYSMSIRQKLNMQSSTESEIAGESDILSKLLLMRFILEAQGVKIIDNNIFQNNQSAPLLERNGRTSSSKLPRHINICYF